MNLSLSWKTLTAALRPTAEKLDLALEEHNVNSPFPVSLARGYAYVDTSQGDITQSIQDAVHRADLDMYENKREIPPNLMQGTLLLYMQSKHRSEIFFETGVFVFSFIESNNHPLCMNKMHPADCTGNAHLHYNICLSLHQKPRIYTPKMVFHSSTSTYLSCVFSFSCVSFSIASLIRYNSYFIFTDFSAEYPPNTCLPLTFRYARIR